MSLKGRNSMDYQQSIKSQIENNFSSKRIPLIIDKSSKLTFQAPARIQQDNGSNKLMNDLLLKSYKINVISQKSSQSIKKSSFLNQSNSDDEYEIQKISEPKKEVQQIKQIKPIQQIKPILRQPFMYPAENKQEIYRRPVNKFESSDFYHKPLIQFRKPAQPKQLKPQQTDGQKPIHYDDEFDRQKLKRMFKFPASFKEAQIHAMASKFGRGIKKIKRDISQQQQLSKYYVPTVNKQEQQTLSPRPTQKIKQKTNQQQKYKKIQHQNVPVCPCCQNLVANHQLPWCYPTQPVQPKNGEPKFALQTGVTLYFAFIKIAIACLLYRFLIYDIFIIISSVTGQFCSDIKLDKTKQNDLCSFITVSGYNLKSAANQNSLDIIEILSLVVTIGTIILFIWYRRKQNRLITWLDRNNISQKDFSILIQNVPLINYQKSNNKQVPDFNYQKILKQHIEAKIKEMLQRVLKQEDPDQFDEDLEYDFWKYVYMRKVRQAKVKSEMQNLQKQKKMQYDIWYKSFVKKAKQQEQQAIQNAKQKKLGIQVEDKATTLKTTSKKRINIHNKAKSMDEVKKDLRQLIINNQIKVPSITICYDLTEIQTINKRREQLIQLHTKYNQDINSAPQLIQNQQLSSIPKNITLINKQYIQLCRKFALDDTPSFNLSHFTGKAFVSFQYQHYRDYFLRQYEKNKSFFTINGEEITISATNKPQDVYWFNMKVTDVERRINKSYSYAILVMLLVISFASLWGLQVWQSSASISQSPGKGLIDMIKAHIFSVASAILTNIINFILSFSIEVLSDMEKHKTKSDKLNALIIKMIITQTINTGCIYYLIYLVTPTNPLGRQGLAQNIFDLVLVSGIISVALQIIPPKYLFCKLYKHWRYNQNNKINLFQTNLNQILQQPQFDFAVMYAFYIVFTFVVSFYGFLVPEAAPVLIVIFFIQYWVDKYNLFKRYSCPVDLGATLIRYLFKMFQISILLFVLGHLYWDLKVRTQLTTISKIINFTNILFVIAYGLLQTVVPTQVRQCVFRSDKKKFDSYSYTSFLKENAFNKTFYRQNPATSCLKETKLKNTKFQKNNIQKDDFVYEAPDPQFVFEDEVMLNKYLFLLDERKQLQKYNKFDVKYYKNYQNQDWDQIEAEKQLRQRQQILENIKQQQKKGQTIRSHISKSNISF